MAASPEFTKAVTESKKLSKTPGQDEMLEVYSSSVSGSLIQILTLCCQLYKYYKQGTQDPPYAQAPQPGTFDLKVNSTWTTRLGAVIDLMCRAKRSTRLGAR